MSAYIEYGHGLSLRIGWLPWGAGQLTVTPFALHDGEPVTVLVEHVGADVYRVSDRAMAADALAMAGVDLSTPAMARSWNAIQNSIDERFRVLGGGDDWELVATAQHAYLAQAVDEVIAAVLRADGLSTLRRPKSAVERLDRSVIRAAHEAGLEALPHAPARMRSGARRNVTARVATTGAEPRVALLQTFGPSLGGWDIADRARGIFQDLAEEDEVLRVSVLGARVELDEYQLAAVNAVSEVVREPQLAAWMRDRVAG